MAQGNLKLWRRRLAAAQVNVIIPARNAKFFLPLTLLSLSQQTFTDWCAVIINDASTDQTSQVALRTINQLGLRQKVYLVNQPRRRYVLANTVWALTNLIIRPQTIVCVLDGDDWLIRSDALAMIAKKHKRYDVVWTKHLRSDGTPGISRRLPKEAKPRQHRWVSSHFRTFKRYLFTPIKLADLKDNHGRYYRAAADLALMFPVLELAGPKRWHFLPIATYTYNFTLNPLSWHKKRWGYQYELEHQIRRQNPYQPLTEEARKNLLALN